MYRDVTERVSTFEYWPEHINWVTPKTLATNGFVYTGTKDKVRCVFCTATVEEWEEGDNPEGEHADQSPECPFVKLLNNGSPLKEGTIIH